MSQKLLSGLNKSYGRLRSRTILGDALCTNLSHIRTIASRADWLHSIYINAHVKQKYAENKARGGMTFVLPFPGGYHFGHINRLYRVATPMAKPNGYHHTRPSPVAELRAR